MADLSILHVVGARPNFMKAAPVVARLKQHPEITQLLLHTGQHYDNALSSVFFEELGLPRPDLNLEVGSASHAVQTAQIITRFEPVARTKKPDLVLVYGDVNSTAACALVCAKLLIPVGHVEAGLRSFDRTMPEEINRIVTDHIADLLFTPSEDGDRNLLREGIPKEHIFRTGNVMIDTLLSLLPKARMRWRGLLERFGYDRFGLVTLHRPSNVDNPATLRRIVDALREISGDIPLLFPVHPRTRKHFSTYQINTHAPHLHILDPLGYLDFLCLQAHATLVVTDSGGIQEETTFLGVPCITVRENTERPVTLTMGTNVLVGHDMAKLKEEVHRILRSGRPERSVPPLWDGKAGERIARIVRRVVPGTYPLQLQE